PTPSSSSHSSITPEPSRKTNSLKLRKTSERSQFPSFVAAVRKPVTTATSFAPNGNLRDFPYIIVLSLICAPI
ncbi:MAG: hypothetical protein J6866_02640, partial [Victivallales bacterium]|nr:hypothetical protein [Victivallales bacterium]